jgi:hypothetical protein
VSSETTEPQSLAEIYVAAREKLEAERQAPPEPPVAQPSSEPPGGEPAVSETEAYLAELEEAEARAAGLLDSGAADEGAAGVIRHMRTILKKNRKAVDRIWHEARTEARLELIRERQSESNYRRLSVPESARALFSGVDPTDTVAMRARATELQEAGISWAGQPQPPAPPPPDPNAAAVAAMQAAAAGASGPAQDGDLFSRMQAMKANPDKYTDEQHSAIVKEYNRAVDSAARKGGAGARG